VRIRLWLVGLVCLVCALASRAVYWIWTPPHWSEEAAGLNCLQAGWLGTGLLLLAVSVHQSGYGRRPRTGPVGERLTWTLGAVAAGAARGLGALATAYLVLAAVLGPVGR
jgi:hypothetical protein